MNLGELNTFLSGAIGLGFVALAWFFLSFWRRSRLELYGYFALAFALLAGERVVLQFFEATGEFRPLVYSIRLCAFLVIIAGIIIQNQRRA